MCRQDLQTLAKWSGKNENQKYFFMLTTYSIKYNRAVILTALLYVLLVNEITVDQNPTKQG